MPEWIEIISLVSLAVSLICMLIIAFDIISGRRQHMSVMNIVWPVTALYSGPLGLLFYFKLGRAKPANPDHSGKMMHHNHDEGKPFLQSAAISATHCGAGCTLGDLAAEWIFFLMPFTLFGFKIFGAWLIDYIFALFIGIAFQYFSIKPMKKLGVGEAIVAAVKADVLSLTAWQVGMYGWMAIAVFLIFGREIPATDPVFWFMMQIAMLFGFATSYPVNMLLLKSGIKEKM